MKVFEEERISVPPPVFSIPPEIAVPAEITPETLSVAPGDTETTRASSFRTSPAEMVTAPAETFRSLLRYVGPPPRIWPPPVPKVSEVGVIESLGSLVRSTVPPWISRAPTTSLALESNRNRPSLLTVTAGEPASWSPRVVTTAESGAPIPSPITRGPAIEAPMELARASVPSSTSVVPV